MELKSIFENNFLNFIVLFIALGVLWSKVMPGIFQGRKHRIDSAIAEAGRAKEEGNAFLNTQKARIANAEKEADQILVEAKETAEAMKRDIADSTRKDIENLHIKIDQQIATHRQMVITELRSQAATLAVRLAEASLPGAITPAVKQGLQERFINQLDSIGSK
jgi:F-type H+-transporting ATPase subunit b